MYSDDYYSNDPRDNARDRTKAITVEIEQDDGSFVEVELPTVWEVCDLCDGEGSHVNPSIDSHGLSAEDFDDDPDFRDSYMRGDYDVTCAQCHGLRVMRVVDEARCDKALLAAYDAQQRDLADYYAECAAERRMGA